MFNNIIIEKYRGGSGGGGSKSIKNNEDNTQYELLGLIPFLLGFFILIYCYYEFNLFALFIAFLFIIPGAVRISNKTHKQAFGSVLIYIGVVLLIILIRILYVIFKHFQDYKKNISWIFFGLIILLIIILLFFIYGIKLANQEI